MQSTIRSSSKHEDDKVADKFEAQKQLVEELKVQWKLLWGERYDDKVRAEGVSVHDYERLRVERGAIIHATRDFKALSFREILDQNLVENPDRYIPPDVAVGGWSKFIRANITNPQPQKRRRRAESYVPEKRVAQQPKKGGRGWLHR